MLRVLEASAGTGKTHSLVELCIELLREGLEPARLCAVTFTEKAAAELKGRLRARVDGLAQDAFWHQVRRELGQAQVGTIHSLCGQILRRHAAAAGIDPQFGQLDETQGVRMRREACESTALRALEGALGTEPQKAARRLCAEMGLRTQGKYGAGLADELASLLGKLGETGRMPPLPADPLAEDAAARRDLVTAMDGLRETARRASVKAAYAVPAFDPAWLDYAPGQLALSWPRLRAASPHDVRKTAAIADAIDTARKAWDALLDADAGIRGAALSRDLALLAEAASQEYRARKARAAALDFDDLTRLCRDVLSQGAPARDSERARIGALLIDEFQDTSATQLEVFEMLSGASVAVVGDRKQSIYDFRGADVAGAQRFAQALLGRGAERRVLTESRRSLPPLVEFTNLLFARALAAAERPFDTPFTPDDAVRAIREGAPGPCAELLETSGAGVEAEAEMVARRIESLLASVRGGDIAILLRRFTNLEAFRRALLKRRIPHLVHRGRGFHATQEVLDLKSLLQISVDPDDTLALAAVLRSPLGLLSDDALVLLARGGQIDLRHSEGLAPDDAEALKRVASLLRSLQREVDRLGPAALLEAAIAHTDYVAACAGGLQGEQAAANIDKLLSLARAAEQRGEGVREFLASLVELAEDEAREPEAAVVEDRDPHAVRILTVHAAKGLEFPVVVVPECAAPSQQNSADRVAVDGEGLFVKVRGADGVRRWGRDGRAASDRKRERELSQSRRLFYVAVTRARDLLVLSARPPRGQQESWRGFIDAVSAEAAQRGLLRVLRDVPSPPPREVGRAPADPEDLAALPAGPHPDLARIEAGAKGARPCISAPVTQLADASLCPRRYQLLHELRLEERALPATGGARRRGALEPRPGTPPQHDPTETPAVALGALAHRLLELLPLKLEPQARRAELERLLALEGEDPARHGEVLDAACAFLDSPLGKRMAQVAPEQLQRELPFALRLQSPDAELLVRGQIDALLLDDGAATVVDYKLSQARDPDHYAAQLDAYALAAHELLQASPLPVRTGIVFLRSPGAPFAQREPAAAAEVRARLLGAAHSIAEGRRTGMWPTVERDRCRDIGCGFVERCHST